MGLCISAVSQGSALMDYGVEIVEIQSQQGERRTLYTMSLQ